MTRSAARRVDDRIEADEVVLKRGRRTAKASLKATDLHDSAFDQERLRRQTYLTVPELCAYARFVHEETGLLNPGAAYSFLSDTPQLNRWRRGRTVIVKRTEVDEVLNAEKQVVKVHEKGR